MPGQGRPFQPGQSGNPGGRPKIAEELRKRCLKAVEEHVIAYWLEQVETRGDDATKCSELLAAYGLGKPTQVMALTGQEGEAAPTITVTFVKPDAAKG